MKDIRINAHESSTEALYYDRDGGLNLCQKADQKDRQIDSAVENYTNGAYPMLNMDNSAASLFEREAAQNRNFFHPQAYPPHLNQ